MPPRCRCSFSHGGSWPSLLLAFLRVPSVTLSRMEERQVKGRQGEVCHLENSQHGGGASSRRGDRLPWDTSQILWVDFQQQVVVANQKGKRAAVIPKLKNRWHMVNPSKTQDPRKLSNQTPLPTCGAACGVPRTLRIGSDMTLLLAGSLRHKVPQCFHL